jgi:hypothetical protein
MTIEDAKENFQPSFFEPMDSKTEGLLKTLAASNLP